MDPYYETGANVKDGLQKELHRWFFSTLMSWETRRWGGNAG
jgi:hypothetical protein